MTLDDQLDALVGRRIAAGVVGRRMNGHDIVLLSGLREFSMPFIYEMKAIEEIVSKFPDVSEVVSTWWRTDSAATISVKWTGMDTRDGRELEYTATIKEVNNAPQN